MTLILGKIYTDSIIESGNRVVTANTIISYDTSNFNQEKAIKEFRKKIRGREQEPAGFVFENIRYFERTSADRLLRILEMGFSNSPGVICSHCHNPNDWSSNENPKIQIACDMMAMVGKINSELLCTIANMDSENPTVNCTTCHRRQVKAALRIDISNRGLIAN